MGSGLSIPELPLTYAEWQVDRQRHLEQDLLFSEHTVARYSAYRCHLGPWRYALLRQVQAALVPNHVRRLLDLPERSWLHPLLGFYPTVAELGLRPVLRWVLIPSAYRSDVQALDHPDVR